MGILDTDSDETQTSIFDVPDASPEELQQLLNDIQLAQARVDNIIRTGNFSADLFANLPSELARISSDPANRKLVEEGQFNLAAGGQGLTGELQRQEFESIQKGSRIDPKTEALIDQVFESQFQSGKGDIDQSLRDTLKIIRDELAPQLGLRPEDTPNLDRAARVAAETVRQTGQLKRGLDSASATAKLNFPLQQDALTSKRINDFSNTAEGQTEFLNKLQQQAFLNRQLLVDQAGNFGNQTAIATGANPGTTTTNLGANRVSLAPETITSNTTTGANPADLITGVGGLIRDLDEVFDICWVAREVYGDHNPRWLLFRQWLFTKAPKLLLHTYIRFGERFALFIHNKPRTKTFIRKLMDKAIGVNNG